MAKRKGNNAPNIPAQTLARARAELYGGNTNPEISSTPQTGAAVAAAPRTPAKTPSKAVYKAVSVEDLRNEYIYVLTDIRNMAVLAGLLFVAMVVAALIVV